MPEPFGTHLLEAFVEVCRHNSVSEAARALGRTQPAISYRIRQLEEQAGVKLFERSGRSMQLTRRGELLLEEAESIMARLRAVQDMLSGTDDVPRGSVTIGTFATVARHYLDKAFGSAIARWPEVKWKVEIGLVSDLMQQLRDGSIDVLYLIGDIDVHGLDVVEIEPIKMCLAVPPSIWDSDEKPTATHLQRHRLLMWRGHFDPTFTMVENRARALGLMNPNTPEIPDIDTLRKLAKQGLGYTIIPDYVFREDVERGELRAFPLEGFDIHLPLRSYVVARRYQSAALRAFTGLVMSEL
jgi:DNA-binding transcriptional LysR family regulator